MRKNEKGQQITIIKPEELAKRMKIIKENIQIIMTKRSTSTPPRQRHRRKSKKRDR